MPLTELLKKDNKFLRSEQCQKSFEIVKEMLINYPIIIAPNFGKPLAAGMDVSNVGSGAVLLQGSGAPKLIFQ